MIYTRLGRTGLEISRICMGCMSFGDPSQADRPWSLDEADSAKIIGRALDLGINFFDTANVYSTGISETITGKVLWDLVPRHEIVLATKVHGKMREGPNGQGQSRKAIMFEIDQSLKRLGTDYVDLYQIHRFDYHTPIEETLEALHDVVKAGKARYIGASSMYAFQFMKMLALQEKHGWTKFVSMQNHLNLLYREEEREMVPLCRSEGIGLIPWSPLARGKLTRAWGETTKRSETDGFGKQLYGQDKGVSAAIVGAVVDLAKKRGVPPAQIALAWVLAKDVVSAPIVGATKPEQIEDAASAVELELSASEIAALEAPYHPLKIEGFS